MPRSSSAPRAWRRHHDEGVQALLLGLVMPAPIALVVVVVTRVWSLAVDALFLLCALAPTWFGRRRTEDRGDLPAA
jgi:hypothetical protein